MDTLSNVKYRRILLKISGEALAGDAHRGLNFDIVNKLCDSIADCVKDGVMRTIEDIHEEIYRHVAACLED